MVDIQPKTYVKPLQVGDEVITVAASSAINDEHLLVEGIKVLESWGLTCKKHSKLIKSAIKNKNYKESLDLYKDIKWHLNKFFNKVLVNVDQSNIKANRLNILSLVRDIFSEYADFSIIDLRNENK